MRFVFLSIKEKKMDLKSEMEGLREGVNRELEIFLDEKSAKAERDGMPKEFSETVLNIREFVLRGGKRLRPTLFYCGYILAGGTDKKEALRVAIALEFLHTGLLIHDDVMDRDNVRHGGPSMHYKYETDYGVKLGRVDLQHFGFSMAVCAGDAALAWSYEALVNNNFEDRLKIRAVALMSDILTETTMGQMMDESLQIGNDFDEQMIEKVYDYKTARYTIMGPLQLGAIFAGAGETEVDFMSEFAIPLGVAFQMQDDILGVFGDMKKTGKPVGSDLREGKKTLLVAYAIKNAAAEDREFILSHLGKKDLTQEDVMKMREIIENSGALKYSEDKISRLTQDFLDKLENGGDDAGNKYLALKDLAGYLLKRKE